MPIDDPEAQRAIDEILETLLADDRRSWRAPRDGRWQRTERLTGGPGTIDAQQLLKERAADALARLATRHAPRGVGRSAARRRLEPWA